MILDTIDKVKELNKYREENNLEFNIEVDGGINGDTIKLVKEAGADVAVVGSFIIKSKDYIKAIQELKNNLL